MKIRTVFNQFIHIYISFSKPFLGLLLGRFINPIELPSLRPKTKLRRSNSRVEFLCANVVECHSESRTFNIL